MKRLLLASTALCAALAPSAFAADLPTVKGPPPAPAVAPPVFNWTGFYIGGNVGAMWSQDGVETTDGFGGLPVGTTDTVDPSGLVGGVQAGYNYQFSNIVAGVEGDLDWSSARGSRDSVWGLTGLNHTASTPFFGDVRARLGLAVDRFLPYVTGGVVFAEQRNSLGAVFLTPPSTGRSEGTGWAIGAGVEYAIDNHWSAKAEYLYTQFPDANGTLFAGAPYTFKFKDSADIARLGLNYRF
jgi:outer membrane immunogenic protein